MVEEINNQQILHRLFEQISQHLETRLEYISLTSTEKLSNLAANVAGAIVIFVFGVLVLFFFSMGFAWWLGGYVGSLAGGFALSGLVFVPIAFVVFGWIRPYVRTKIIQSMLHDEVTAKIITIDPTIKHG